MVSRDTGAPQNLPGRPPVLFVGQREEKVLGRDIVVLEAIRLGLGRVEDRAKLRRGVDLRRHRGAGKSIDGLLDLREQHARRDTELF